VSTCRTDHGRNEPVSVPRYGLDEPRIGGLVAQGLAQLLDALGQRAVSDNDILPDLRKEPVLGDQLGTFANQEAQCVEVPRVQIHALSIAPELTVGGVEFEGVKHENRHLGV
jgi:hypothetical protein